MTLASIRPEAELFIRQKARVFVGTFQQRSTHGGADTHPQHFAPCQCQGQV